MVLAVSGEGGWKDVGEASGVYVALAVSCGGG